MYSSDNLFSHKVTEIYIYVSISVPVLVSFPVWSIKNTSDQDEIIFLDSPSFKLTIS